MQLRKGHTIQLTRELIRRNVTLTRELIRRNVTLSLILIEFVRFEISVVKLFCLLNRIKFIVYLLALNGI